MSRLIPLFVALIFCSCLFTAHLMLDIHERSAQQVRLAAQRSLPAPCDLGSCLRAVP
ncbi:hypothetical protein ACNFH5_21075 [Pseudomonas sp. NY15435]|uniref:hypothetical protein n=1 Tax=Pseudomonas sp. NY15435 TaxID=3400358 RepID=UPI003A87EA36